MYEFKTQRRIEFADTDMGGITHFSRYFVFMETAEHQFLEAVGSSVALEVDGKQVGWPRVAASCEYKRPARFGEVIDIDVRVSRKGEKSMTYEFTFSREGVELATGRMTSVCCVLDPSEEVRAIPIPPFIADKLDEPPPDRER
jgi:4-hydroxybenzoyl-CoA thioesterase/acyl-CoA thioester hydrolase